MSTRIIKLKLLTQVQPVVIETSARTLEEFKNEPTVKELGIDWSSTKLINRANTAVFELDKAILPEIDSFMFVTPTKTKSGVEYVNWSFTELRKECAVRSSVSVSHNPTKKEMIAALEEDDAKKSGSELSGTSYTTTPVKGKEVIQRVIVLEEYKGVPVPADFNETFADFVTLEEVNKEAEELKEFYS